MSTKPDLTTPRAFAGDEVYFRHAQGPASGRVLCTGKHGMTVECNGGRRQVRWEHLLGHKKRNIQRLHVVDKGEDGLIVRDSAGKHHYVGVPPEAKAERLELDGKKTAR